MEGKSVTGWEATKARILTENLFISTEQIYFLPLNIGMNSNVRKEYSNSVS